MAHTEKPQRQLGRPCTATYCLVPRLKVDLLLPSRLVRTDKLDPTNPNQNPQSFKHKMPRITTQACSYNNASAPLEKSTISNDMNICSMQSWPCSYSTPMWSTVSDLVVWRPLPYIVSVAAVFGSAHLPLILPVSWWRKGYELQSLPA